MVNVQQQGEISALSARVTVIEATHPEALGTRIDNLTQEVKEMRQIGYGILVAVFINLLTSAPRMPFTSRKERR